MNGFVQVVRRQRGLQIFSVYREAVSGGTVLVYQVHPGSEPVASLS